MMFRKDTPESMGQQLLLEAARSQECFEEEKVYELIKKGALLHLHDEDGNSLLGLAARENHAVFAANLIKGGAFIDHRNSDGNTPLMLAAYGGNIAIVALLLERGAKLDFANRGGNTARSWAAKMGHTNIVQMLDDAEHDRMQAFLKAIAPAPASAEKQEAPQPRTIWPKGFQL